MHFVVTRLSPIIYWLDIYDFRIASLGYEATVAADAFVAGQECMRGCVVA